MEPETELTRLRHELAEADAIIARLTWRTGTKLPPWPEGSDAQTARLNHERRIGAPSDQEIG